MTDISQSSDSQSPKLIIPALGGIYDRLKPFAYPLVRVTCGALLIPHGFAKLFQDAASGTAFFMAMTLGGHPKEDAGNFVGDWINWAYYLGVLELVGGTFLVIGLLTRIVAAQVLVFMIVAMFWVHWGFGYFWNKTGWEMPLMWGLLAIVVLIRGGGEMSVDRKIGKEL